MDPLEAKKVLVPVNGDACDAEALWLASSLTKKTKGKVYVLYVIEVQRNLPLDASIAPESAKGEAVLQRMERLGHDYHCNVEAEILQARDAGPAVVQEAVQREVEAIIMGVPYQRRHGVFTLGETVPYILKNAPCPVLLLRSGWENNGVRPVPGTRRQRHNQ